MVPTIDGEIRKSLQKILEKQKMKFMLKTKVVGLDSLGGGVRLTLEPASGANQSTLEADGVLVSTGRSPYTKGLGLEELGVKTDKMGHVEVDDHFRTNIPGIYTIGDVIPGLMPTHEAEEDGIAYVELIAGKGWIS
eukprot:Gb_09295 [translate_table: standard]